MNSLKFRLVLDGIALTGSVTPFYSDWKIDLRRGGQKMLTGFDQDATFSSLQVAAEVLIKRAQECAKAKKELQK